MEDDVILNQSSTTTFDEQEFLKDIILEEPECIELSSYLCSNKTKDNSTTIINVEGDATSPTNSILSFDETSLFCGDYENVETNHKSNNSNSIKSLERSCVSSPATYLLSFGNSSIEPIIEPMSHKTKRRTDESRGVKEATKKVRRSCETVQDHLMAERKRRRELTENIIALSAMIPGLKKMDKCYVLSEAVNYTKQLQKRIKELENQNKDSKPNPAIFKWKSQVSSNKKKSSESLLEVEARVKEKEVLIRIHCEKQKDIVLKIHELLEKFNITITSSSMLPFGDSILVINICAQMDEEDSMTMDDLVENLRKYLLETHESYL
ncbi:helix loop helix DNA-binding domain protein [Medicago truncatula]|nr:helix loop helix DNA-binding domain protein [Medicago truncatula]